MLGLLAAKLPRLKPSCQPNCGAVGPVLVDMGLLARFQLNGGTGKALGPWEGEGTPSGPTWSASHVLAAVHRRAAVWSMTEREVGSQFATVQRALLLGY